MFESGLTMPYVNHSTSISAGTCTMEYIHIRIYVLYIHVCIFCIITS